MADSINGNRLNENFELVVNDGWLYLYDTTNDIADTFHQTVQGSR